MRNPFERFEYRWRLVASVILAPILGDIVVMLAFLVLGVIPFMNLPGGFMFGLVYAYPTIILIGLPYHLALRHWRKLDRRLYYAIGGFIIGTLVLSGFMGDATRLGMFAVGFGGLPGIVIALIARWIVGPIKAKT